MKLKLSAFLLSMVFMSGCVQADQATQEKLKKLDQEHVTQSAQSNSNKTESSGNTKDDLKLAPKPALVDLAPTVDQAKAAVIAANVLTRFEYDKKPLDAKMSEDIYNKYLESLDPQRMFFTQADIKSFDHAKSLMNQMLLNGRLDIPFAMFDVYRKRVEQRYDAALASLDTKFDFDKKESINIDRKKAAWPENNEQANDLWRKRVKNDFLRLKLAGTSDEKIYTTLKKRYTNNRNQILRTSNEDAGEIFINSYAEATDPHTNYYSPTSAKNFDVQISLSVEGIGAVLQKRDEYAQIREVVAGGPADKSGKIHPGDRIVAVGQGADGPMEDVIDWRLDDIVKKIRGKRESVVRVEIIPNDSGMDGKTQIVTLTRQKVALEDQAARSKTIEVKVDGQNKKIAVITIPSFYEDFDAKARGSTKYKSVSNDVKDIIQKLKANKVDGILLDLRNNGGGSLSEAANLSGLFLGGDRPIVQVRNAEGSVYSVRSDRSVQQIWDGPLGVIVNRLSASASEIFAGAMSDYDRAVIIGSTTWGKGSVQTIRALNDLLGRPAKEDLGSLKWTIQKFFRVNGSSTQEKGVDPSIVYPSLYDTKEVGESSYDNAMKWSKIDPAQYTIFQNGSLEKLLPELDKLHEQRIKNSSSWKLMIDENDYTRSLTSKKSLSLNYNERLKERNDMEAKRKSFEERRKALGESDINMFSLDDGLAAGEGNLKDELSKEKKLKELVDTAATEASHVVADISVLAAKAKASEPVAKP